MKIKSRELSKNAEKTSSLKDRVAALGYAEITNDAWRRAARLACVYRLYEHLRPEERRSPTDIERYLIRAGVVANAELNVNVVALSIAARAELSECELISHAMELGAATFTEGILRRARLVGDAKLVGCTSVDAPAIVALVEFLYNFKPIQEANARPTSASDVRIVRASAQHLAQHGVEFAVV